MNENLKCETANMLIRFRNYLDLCTYCVKKENGTCPYQDRIEKAVDLYLKHSELAGEYIADKLGENPYGEAYKRMNLVYGPIYDCDQYESISKQYQLPSPIVTLCGSSSFKEDFEQEAARLNKEGNIVLSLNVFSNYDEEMRGIPPVDDVTMQMLKNIHIEKIMLSNRIHVINKGGYIGESTKDEIAVAKKLGLEITYMEPIEENKQEKEFE